MGAQKLDQPFVLGIDLGVQSLGWAIITLDEKDNPAGVVRLGVRCFDSGVGSEEEVAQGKEQSQNVERRGARLLRRQTWRRARRIAKVFHLLQRFGLLPAAPSSTPEQRDALIKKLDAGLRAEYLPAGDRVAQHLLSYRLRALGLDQPLSAFAFGRALLHIAQRRGFLSNRKAEGKETEKERSVVKDSISFLQSEIARTGSRTIGEYFAGLDPEEQRIRGRYTARQMYLDEFEKLWAAQAPHHQLDDAAKQAIHQAIFFQRPLKSQSGLIGMCELEPSQRRAPLASLEAQRFRYLQKVNDLLIITPEGFILAPSEEQRAQLIDYLEHHAEITFDKLRTLWGLKVPRKPRKSSKDEPAESDERPGYNFNLERGGEKKLKGNVTRARVETALGFSLDDLMPDVREPFVTDLLEYENADALQRRLVQRYRFSEEQAAALAATTFEPGYASLSLVALRKLLPPMEQGTPFATARKALYDQAQQFQPKDTLPPLFQVKSQLRNPAVSRGLNELRKVVNAVIQRYGKPNYIRIELARDLKRPRKAREEIAKTMRKNEAVREQIVEQIRKFGIARPSEADILKVRLADECNWECPYSGKAISMETLLGPHPQFDIEHIVPYSRSLDNSFTNKTLCDVHENRMAKRNLTPYEAYSGNEQRWHEIIARVRRFRGPAAAAKLRKFSSKQLDSDFAERQLVDTRYMSRAAAEYVGLLYGGSVDAHGTRRVQVSAGGVTADLRRLWGLNRVLPRDPNDDDSHPGKKSRSDHRHHAIDAAVIAMTSQALVALLSKCAQEASMIGSRRFLDLDLPWPSLIDDLKKAVDEIIVSYRVKRKVRGRLHDQTNYSPPKPARDAKGNVVEYRHVRKPLAMISADRIEKIVDPVVREIVQKHLDRHGGDLKKAFGNPNNLPYLTARDGRIIPIRKVRIRENIAVLPIGKPPHLRFAAPGTNHHMEIVAVTDSRGRVRWEGKLVNMFEAYQRRRQHIPVVCRDHGPNAQFLFSLACGEYVEMEHVPGERKVYRVLSISSRVVEFRLHSDARPITELRKLSRARVTRSPGALLEAKARKVFVDPLGNVYPAGD